MISSRWTGANALAVRIRPPFEGTREGTDSALDLAGIAQSNRAQLDTERRRHGLQSAQLSGARGYRRISKDCNALEVRRDLLQQLEHFPLMPYSKLVNPVALPPGRARLSTKPAPTGSDTSTNTIGTVRVDSCRAATGGLPVASRTSGASATNSAASLRTWSISPTAQR